MYAGAVAVLLIVGRALKLSPEQVALLISADLFCCGLVTLIQSLGFGRYFGIRLPVMMGVTFAAVGPMVAMANASGGVDGARAIFGAIIGVSLMRVGVGWAMGAPANFAQSVDAPKLLEMTEPLKSRWVCVAAGVIIIMIVLGISGIVMFDMVAATGIRILSNVDFKGNRYNLYIVALAIGAGMISLAAPRWTQHMAHSLHPLLKSGILLTAVSAVLFHLFFNGARADEAGAVEAARLAEAH